MLSPPWFYLYMGNNKRRQSESYLKLLIWEFTKLSDLAIKLHSIIGKACANIYSSSYALLKYIIHLSDDLFWHRHFPLSKESLASLISFAVIIFIPPINCFFLYPPIVSFPYIRQDALAISGYHHTSTLMDAYVYSCSFLL